MHITALGFSQFFIFGIKFQPAVAAKVKINT